MDVESKEMAGNLARVRERIESAAARSGRAAEEITLIAVSKTHSAARIHELFQLGVRHFGENRVQEWESKRASLANLGATWHMIGHVQSNKSARVVRLFDSVDTVDSLHLAERLEGAKKDFNTEDAESTEGTEKTEKSEERKGGVNSAERLRVLIEVKLDPGPAKSGVLAEELPRLVEAVLVLPHLELCGLMGVPPYFDDPEEARPYFRRLRELRDAVRVHAGREALPVLSMGMSHDFEVAIEEGATEIRVGTALFGERPKA
jgi:pyridoxal phosphate enzyme (YggS family)